MCEVVEEKLSFPEDLPPEEEPEELVQARQELKAKAREMRNLQKELDQLSRKLAGKESHPPAVKSLRRSPAASATSPISPTGAQPRCAPATGPDRIRGQGPPGTH